MQLVLLAAGLGSLSPLKQLGTGSLLILLRLFNAVTGLHQEGKAAAIQPPVAARPEPPTPERPSATRYGRVCAGVADSGPWRWLNCDQLVPFSRTLKVRQLFEGSEGIIRTVITGAARCFSVGHGPQIVPWVPL